MKKALLVLGLVLACATTASAQVEYSVGNWLKYGNGNQTSGLGTFNKEFIENQTNVRLYWSGFTIGFQYLYDNPPENEFAPSYRGLKKRFVEFQREGLELRAGDFYTLYGKGLALNLFENRGINYDTGLDGLRAAYSHEYFNVIFAGGSLDYYDLLDPTRIESYMVKSGHLDLKPAEFLTLGGSLVGVEGKLPSVFGTNQLRADILEGTITMRGMGLEMTASYAHKKSWGTELVPGLTPFEKAGEGIYGSLSYASASSFGFTFEYKDYRFDEADPLADRNRPTRVLPIQNPPIVMKEHGFNLLTRNPHAIDFNDEIGMQFDAFYSPSSTVTLNLNGSVASRHKAHGFTPGVGPTVEGLSTSFLPGFERKFSPFYEVYTEVEWYFDGESYLRAAFNFRRDEIYHEKHTVYSYTLPFRIEYVLPADNSISINLEQQLYHDSQRFEKPDYYNQFVGLTFAHSPLWSLSLRMEYTTDTKDPSGRDFWTAVEGTYRLGNSHTATVTYGTERGGLICSNGICRQVQPFEGVRLSLLTQL